MKTNSKLIRLVFAALLAALTCVATLVIRVPTPTVGGYINLGDGIVLVSGWLLGPVYGFLAGGVGSALADLIGYPAYAPATFLIKGLQALVAWLLFSALSKMKHKTLAYIISAVAAQLVMVGGYYVYEGFLYGFGASLVNIPLNLLQSAAGIAVSVLIISILNKTNISSMLRRK